jgi:hypothetical protein
MRFIPTALAACIGMVATSAVSAVPQAAARSQNSVQIGEWKCDELTAGGPVPGPSHWTCDQGTNFRPAFNGSPSQIIIMGELYFRGTNFKAPPPCLPPTVPVVPDEVEFKQLDSQGFWLILNVWESAGCYGLRAHASGTWMAIGP